jgi:hypothetical protein
MGLSPRGSFVNVAEAAEPGSPLLRDEKARMRAESEIKGYALRQVSGDFERKDKDKDKVEVVPAGSPGECLMRRTRRKRRDRK